MAVYPPGPSRLAQLPDLAGGQAPADLAYLVDASVGTTAGIASDRLTTLNDLFETITKNITAKTLIFEDALAVRSVSAVNTGKIDYNATAQSFQVSENGGAYQNLLKGSGTATRVAFWSAADELSSDGALYWQNTDKRLGIGVGTTPDGPLDVLADGSALAQQWRANTGTLRVQMILDTVPEASLGTSSNHTFHLLSNNLQRLTVENDGLIGINKASAIQAQLQVVSQDAATETLILNSAASPSANIAEFYNDSSIRFAFSPSANLGIGLSGAGGATGSITLNGLTSGAVNLTVAAVAGTWTLTLPTTDGNAGQFLQTDGNGVTTWATAITGAAPPAAAVQFNDGANGFDGDPDFLWDTASGTLQLGVAASRTGKLQLRSVVSGSVTLTVGTPSAAHVIAFPDGLPTVNQVLTAGAVAGNNVTLSWTTPSGGAPGAPLNSVQFNSASAFAGNAGLLYIPGSTTGNELELTSATITSGNLFSIAATGTVAASNTKTALRVATSGANGTAGQTSFGAQISNTSTGTTSTNIALQLTASGGATANTALNVTAGQIIANTGTITTSQPAIDLSQTWNNAAITFTGLKFNVTSTASNSGSLIADFQIGGTSTIRFQRGGSISITDLGFGDYSFRSTGATPFRADTAGIAMTGNKLNLSNSYVINWSSTANWFDTADLGLARAAAGVLRTTDSTTGIGALLVAPSTASVTGSFTVLPNNAATATIVTVARLGVNSTGTAANGFGAALSWSAETSTTNDTESARNNVFWTTATHASRTSATSWSLVNNATLAEVMRLGTPSNNIGSPFVLTIHDGTANPNVWTAGSFAAKLYLTSPTLPPVGVAAHFGSTSLNAPQWQMLRGRGTNASPTAIQSTDSIGNIEWWGQTSTATNDVVAGARIRVSTTENWSAGNNGCQMIFFVSNNASTITERMSLAQTGTLRVGATSGTVSVDNKIQIGNYASWNADATAAIYTEADDNKGLEIIGTSAQTANLFRVFLDAGADLFNVQASGAFLGRVFTVAGLPSAATAGTGARAFVNDALTPVILTAVTGGGAVKVPVYSNGTNWLVG